jgi:hypothetical protein
MKEQLELISTQKSRSGCNFSRLPSADTWLVNLRITSSEKFPYIYCDECPRTTCYRYQYGRSIRTFSNEIDLPDNTSEKNSGYHANSQ